MMNIMNPPADWSTLKKLIWLRGTPINGGEELTVTGTPPLSLPNSLGKPLKAWSVDVLPYQEGTGDPAPDNVRPIHGTDKLTITTAGKNLLQILPTESTVSNGVTFTVNADGTISTQGTASGIAVFRHYITASDLPAGEDLALNGVPSGGEWSTKYGLAFCYANGSVIGSPDSGSGTTISASRLSDLAQVQIVVRNGINVNGKLFTPMIRLASITDSSFTPYLAPSQAALTLPQTVYTGTIGSEGGESRSALRVFNGTENWQKETGVIGGGFWLQLDDMARMTDYRGAIICDKLTAYAVYSSNAYTSAESGITGYPTNTLYAGQNWIYAKAPNCTTLNEFKAWLAQNPITVVYPLATTATFAVPSVTIPTPTGSATTWATAEDGTVDGMEVTYVGKA